jgi:hypothetical protein
MFLKNNIVISILFLFSNYTIYIRMSTDFEKVLVLDDRLDIKNTVKYGVMMGAQQISPSENTANSESINGVQWVVIPPNEQTVIGREILWTSDVELIISGTNASADPALLFDYGRADALAPFPLHQLCQTQQITINNNTISQNTGILLPHILHLLKRKTLLKYNGYAPTALDVYADYKTAVGTNNNSLGAFQNCVDNDYSPRGSWALNYVVGINDDGIKGRFVDVTVAAGATAQFKVGFTSTEPILMSPFLFGHQWSSNTQGMYGINAFNFNFTFKTGTQCRAWRRANIAGAPNADVGDNRNNFAFSASFSSQLNKITNSKLQFMFLTPPVFSMFSSRNVIGYMEMPNTTSVRSISLPKRAYSAVNKSWTASTASVSSDNMQLNQIPDTIIISCSHLPIGGRTPYMSDTFVKILKVRVDFNNDVGLLTSATPQQLFGMSVENGLNSSWNEFNGYANVYSGYKNEQYGIDPSSNGANIIGTSGSMLVLAMGKDIQLQSYFAPGSIGTYSLKVMVDVENQTDEDITQVEFTVIPKFSGIMVLERGTASIYTGILSRQDVIDATKQTPYTYNDVKRVVGGSLNLKELSKSIIKRLPELAKDSVVDAYGSGETGAGMTGAGRRRKLRGRLM